MTAPTRTRTPGGHDPTASPVPRALVSATGRCSNGWRGTFVALGVVAVVLAALAEGAPTQIPWVDACYRAAWIASVLAAVGWVSRDRPNRARLVVVIVLGAVLVGIMHLPPGVGSVVGLPVGTSITLAVTVAVWRQADPLLRSTLRSAALLAAGAVALVALCGAVPLSLGTLAGRSGAAEMRNGLDAYADGEQRSAVDAFGGAELSFQQARSWYSSGLLAPARLIPLWGRQLDALDSAGAIAQDFARLAEATARAANPQELELDRGQIDLQKMASMEAPVSAAATEARRLADRAESIPDDWLLPPVSSRISGLSMQSRSVAEDASLAADGLRVGPAMLGGGGLRRYLVMFASPSESREIGGFVGNFAVLEADQGKVELVRTGRSESINDATGKAGRSLQGAGEFPDRYRRYQPERYWQDITGVPDFPLVALAAQTLFPQSGGGAVDGVAYVDPYALASLLKLTGPVYVKGMDRPLTSENAAHTLLVEQYVAFSDKSDRVDFLEQAASSTFRRLTKGSMPGPRRVARVLGPVIEQRRLMFNSSHPDEQGLLDRLGLAGRFPQPDGQDFLAVVSANANPSKIDAFLRRDIDLEVSPDPISGKVSSVLRIRLQNDAPPSGLPDYVIGSKGQDLPRGTNHSLLSVYTPLQVDSASVDGKRVPTERSTELGWNRWSLFVDVPPKGSVTVEVTMRGETARGTYRLRWWSQPVVDADGVKVHVRSGPGASGSCTTFNGEVRGGVREVIADDRSGCQLPGS